MCSLSVKWHFARMSVPRERHLKCCFLLRELEGADDDHRRLLCGADAKPDLALHLSLIQHLPAHNIAAAINAYHHSIHCRSKGQPLLHSEIRQIISELLVDDEVNEYLELHCANYRGMPRRHLGVVNEGLARPRVGRQFPSACLLQAFDHRLRGPATL